MIDEERDSAGRLVSVVVDGQRFHRAPEASEERSDADGFTVPTWQDLRQLADHNFGLYAEAAAEVRSLRGVVQAVRAMHQKRTATVFSNHHHDEDHVSEDERCDNRCFVPFDLCNGCGGSWPCSTARALAAAADAPHRPTFEQMLSDPDEQFDGKSELLPQVLTYLGLPDGGNAEQRAALMRSIEEYRNAPPCAASAPAQPADPPTCLCGHDAALHSASEPYPCTESNDRDWYCPCKALRGPSPAVLPQPPNPGLPSRRGGPPLRREQPR